MTTDPFVYNYIYAYVPWTRGHRALTLFIPENISNNLTYIPTAEGMA